MAPSQDEHEQQQPAWECGPFRRLALSDLFLGISVVIATFAGPVCAVFVTRHVDNLRRINERRLNVFRSLMATRRAALSADKVTALNMVEIEFYGIPSVQDAHREVMTHINIPPPQPPGWADRHRSLMTRLLSEMARELGYKLPQLDCWKVAITRKVWRILRPSCRQSAALIEVLSGRRPLGVSPAAPVPPAPFPPPPPSIGVSPAAPVPPTPFPPPPPTNPR